MDTYEKVIKEAYNGNIYCTCEYTWKEHAKHYGFKWDPDRKLWYIALDKFTDYTFKKSQERQHSSPVVKYCQRTVVERMKVKQKQEKPNYKEYLFDD